MTHDNALSPEQIYKAYLHTINGIKFTPREIDIISCIVAGKNPQSIATFLSVNNKTIELQTVNTHIVNIRRKISGSSRAQILEFIEKSDKHKIVHNYYTALVIKKEFLKCVTELIPIISPLVKKVYLVSSNDSNKDAISYLQNYFRFIKIETIIAEQSQIPLSKLINSPRKNEFIIYFSLPAEQYEPSSNHLFLFTNKDHNIKKNEPLFKKIYLKDYQNYYYLFFKILDELFPTIKTNIKTLKDRVQKKYSYFYGTEEGNNIPNEANVELNTQTSPDKKMIYILSFLCALIIILIGGYLYNNSNSNHALPPVHSDLMIPVPSVLLNRENILYKINNHFDSNNNKDIQTIALVGQGGSGKTTIARIYASKQTANVIWEINAETKVSLFESVIKLADGLARTDLDKEVLQEIRAIQMPTELIDKLILFVKQRLILYPNWLLIFDNVDNISEVQRYIPHDTRICGSGKVLITTRDSNIKTHKYINHVIDIGELTAEQKLSLFSKIVNDKNFDKQHLISFLENIPPFPLDVSIAAYYIKTTETSFDQYIIDLNQNSNGFDNIQSLLLKETGDYNHTRYNIITLSLEHLISSHPDFRDLLLFISLLDSQNIPRELLDKYKNHIVVDSFIYNLKKYSLISGESLNPLGEVFNMHRSTQAISLAYLTQKFNLTHDKKEFVEKIGKIYWSYISNLVDYEQSLKLKLMLAHSKAFLINNHALEEEIKLLIETSIGYIYYYLGSDLKAKQHLTSSLKKLQKYYNKNHIEKSRILTGLAMTTRRMGDYIEAKRLLQESLTISQKFPEYYIQYIRATSCLGMLHRLLGEYKQAVYMLSESAITATKHPDYPIGIGRSLSNLAEVYAAIGQPEESKKTIDELIISYKDFDKNHIETMWVLTPLGVAYKDIGEPQKAKPILERALKLTEIHFSKDHMQTAWPLLHLGIVHIKLGNYKAAREILTRSKTIHEHNFGANHVQSTWPNLGLGEIELLENNFEEAEKLILPNVQILKNHNHPARHKALELLGDLYSKKFVALSNKATKEELDKLKDLAIKFYKESEEIIINNFPTNSIFHDKIKNKIQETMNKPTPL